MPVETVIWEGDALRGAVVAIDQTRLPGELVRIRLVDAKGMWDAIKRLVIRGAPAIGIAGAFGVVLGARDGKPKDAGAVRDAALKAADTLATSRPTAVNLFWALDRMRASARRLRGGAAEALEALLAEARAILAEDLATGRAIAEFGSALLSDGDAVLTHCNAGGLATGGGGPAPAGVPVTVITDSMAAWTMKTRGIKAVIVGADRIAANGDAANKIGTYGVALSAKAHGIPFYVAAPSSTFDLGLPDGSAIPIEERDPREVSAPFGTPLAPEGAAIFNPAFDVTPHPLITALVTEKGVLRPPFTESIRKAFAREAS